MLHYIRVGFMAHRIRKILRSIRINQAYGLLLLSLSVRIARSQKRKNGRNRKNHEGSVRGSQWVVALMVDGYLVKI